MTTASSDVSLARSQSWAARLPGWLLPAATVLVLCVGYGPLLARYFAQQWSREHYQYFPFVLGAFAWLLWRNSRLGEPRSADDTYDNRVGVLALLAASWVLLAVAYLSDSPLLSLVSAILLVAAAFLEINARWHVPYFWGIWALLWLMVRPPLNRDEYLITELQRISSRLSSLYLDFVGVAHLMEGNKLVLPEKQFFVDEACSGIVSILSIIACAVIYGVWRNRPPVHVALLALAGIGWATLMNVVRITTIAAAFDGWGIDWSSGTSHEVLGLVIFTFIFLALVSTDYLLLALLAPIESRNGNSLGPISRFGRKIVASWDWLQSWGAPRVTKVAAAAPAQSRRSWEMPSRFALGLVPLVAFGTLSGAQLALSYWFGELPGLNAHGLNQALALDAAIVPAQIGPLQLSKFVPQERQRDDIMGQYSRIYEFQDDRGNKYLASCDFPFSEWHDLTVCYKGIGWTQTGDVTLHTIDDAEGQPWDYIEADFTKEDGSAGHLVYSVFDEQGRPVIAPGHSIFSDTWKALERQRRAAQAYRVFQVQIWTTSVGTVRQPQREAAAQLLLEARERIRQAVTK